MAGPFADIEVAVGGALVDELAMVAARVADAGVWVGSAVLVTVAVGDEGISVGGREV